MDMLVPDRVDLSKYIESSGERPIIRGRKVTVSYIAASARENNLSVPQLAYDFTLSEEQVAAALLYYYEHQAEIDTQDKIDAQASEAMRWQHSKRLG